jgi:hypothetical protein
VQFQIYHQCNRSTSLGSALPGRHGQADAPYTPSWRACGCQSQPSPTSLCGMRVASNAGDAIGASMASFVRGASWRAYYARPDSECYICCTVLLQPLRHIFRSRRKILHGHYSLSSTTSPLHDVAQLPFTCHPANACHTQAVRVHSWQTHILAHSQPRQIQVMHGEPLCEPTLKDCQ